MQAHSLLDSVNGAKKCWQRIDPRQKTPHPTHKVSDGSGAWLQFCFPVLSACLPLFWKSEVWINPVNLAPKSWLPRLILRQKSGFFPPLFRTASKIGKECQALNYRVHTHQTSLHPEVDKPVYENCPSKMENHLPVCVLLCFIMWPALTTKWKQQQKALQIANRGGENRIMHQISGRTEAAQMQSSGPGKSGAKRCTPRILVDAKVTFSGEWLFFCVFLKNPAKFCKGLQALDYSMYTHQKSLQFEVAIPLHENSLRVDDFPPFSPDSPTTWKNQQNAFLFANRKPKLKYAWIFKEKKKIHKTKHQNLLSEEVAKRYGLESFSLIHTHSDMSSLDYFDITSFPNLFPQLSKNDLIDMFLLDYKEIRDDSVCVSLYFFFHDQNSNVFLILRPEVRGVPGADRKRDRRTPPPPRKPRGKIWADHPLFLADGFFCHTSSTSHTTTVRQVHVPAAKAMDWRWLPGKVGGLFRKSATSYSAPPVMISAIFVHFCKKSPHIHPTSQKKNQSIDKHFATVWDGSPPPFFFGSCHLQTHLCHPVRGNALELIIMMMINIYICCLPWLIMMPVSQIPQISESVCNKLA